MINIDDLQRELTQLTEEELQIENELSTYIQALVGDRTKSGSSSASKKATSTTGFGSDSVRSNGQSSDILTLLKKIESFGPYFEAMQQDTKKLAGQVEECRGLSDRLSGMVRRLDTMQMRSQQALACTEDIINLKDCKAKILAAIEQRDLSAAVSIIRQVHSIELKAAKVSEDFDIIMEKEKEVKQLVQKDFGEAIAASNIKSVMLLCPLLQTLGLETEARDNFLSFIEKTIFIAVSADANSVEGATDPSTGYAQALSNVFNSTYLIIQQYLPMVIQGLENSLGDVHFIRRLHKRCEQEAGLVLKRYMKYRTLKDTIAGIKSMSADPNGKQSVQPSDIHLVMDELALLIQYCCRYAKYLKHICNGAESKPRQKSVEVSASSTGNTTTGSEADTSNSTAVVVVTVFAGQTEFDKMVDELINKYYMEGEKWLMKTGIRQALPRQVEEGIKLDECFFVLQKCGLRAVASNNIQAACAVLRCISDLLSSDLMNQAAEMLFNSVAKIVTILQESANKYKRSITTGDSSDNKSASISKGLKSAITLASSITGTGSGGIEKDVPSDVEAANANADPWGVAGAIEAFSVLEYCVRYTDRLSKEIYAAGKTVFESGDDDDSSRGAAAGRGAAGRGAQGKSSHLASTEMDKLRLCKEDFDETKMAFNSTLRQGAERLASTAQGIMKDLIVAVLGKSGPYKGLRFDEPDHTFENQLILSSLPKLIITPFENMVNICTFNLSDKNKDMIVGLLADACCERLEQFINQTTFRFPGALKLEEIVRALSTMFTRHSSMPIRGKFSRLREVMMVLTSDNSTSASAFADSLSHLTAGEVDAFIALRIDHTNK